MSRAAADAPRPTAGGARDRHAGRHQPAGDISGGWLPARTDLPAGSVVIRISRWRCAAVSVDRFQFHRPLRMRDEVSMRPTFSNTGRTSMTIAVEA